MAALRKFDANDMEKLLRYLICLIVRYQLIGGGRTGRLEQTCVRVAPAITSGTLKSPAATWKEILPIVPQDEEFKQDFQNYSETKPMRARYLLSELEITKRKTLNPSKKPELGPIKSGDLILEHIYPKNPSQEWKKVDGFDADSLNRLGNFCLLQESLSKSLGSKAFSKKVESYRASELLLTQSLAAYDNWTKDAVDKRQQGLADLAVLAWPRPAQPSAVR